MCVSVCVYECALLERWVYFLCYVSCISLFLPIWCYQPLLCFNAHLYVINIVRSGNYFRVVHNFILIVIFENRDDFTRRRGQCDDFALRQYSQGLNTLLGKQACVVDVFSSIDFRGYIKELSRKTYFYQHLVCKYYDQSPDYACHCVLTCKSMIFSL